VAAMQHGLKAMKTEYKKLDINKIDNLQDEVWNFEWAKFIKNDLIRWRIC
jgi:hypothetical protein